VPARNSVGKPLYIAGGELDTNLFRLDSRSTCGVDCTLASFYSMERKQKSARASGLADRLVGAESPGLSATDVHVFRKLVLCKHRLESSQSCLLLW